jgi:Fe-S-cluster containining protein
MLIKPDIQIVLENAAMLEKVDRFFHDLYREVDAAADEVQFTCKNCKTCCDFDASGLNLFATNLEFAWFLANVKNIPPITANRCPFLNPGVGCTVRRFRPLGCRTYFCSPPKNYDQQIVYESAIAKIKTFIDQNRLPYAYQEWLRGLKEFSTIEGGSNHGLSSW